MEKLLFCNIGWMKSYCGMKNDSIHSGGAYISEHGIGGEIYNFKARRGRYYGYMQPRGNTIKLSRIDENADTDCLDGVTVVWTARRPNYGTVIIGWYKNAKVFSTWRPLNEEKEMYYYVTALEKDSVLLDIDERWFKIPRQEKHGMGQANTWYADKPDNTDFRKKVLTYIKNPNTFWKIPSNTKKTNRGYQQDVKKRQMVETLAIKRTMEFYRKRGFSVYSVEKENKGWDLEAIRDDVKLFLEVKGLSGTNISIELTPNEFSQSKSIKENYRLSIVTRLINRKSRGSLNIFTYDDSGEYFEDSKGNLLKVKELTGARICAI